MLGIKKATINKRQKLKRIEKKLYLLEQLARELSTDLDSEEEELKQKISAHLSLAKCYTFEWRSIIAQ